MLLDAMFGEPKIIWTRVPHPVVIIGNIINWCDVNYNRGQHKLRNGVLTLGGLVTVSILLGYTIASIPQLWILEVLSVAVLLAFRSLIDHVTAVADGLRLSLAEGRIMVAKIVGRDISNLDESGVVRSTIESAAENLSDGFIAPLFWYLLLGLPGLLAYKVINTADSMIAYKSDKYEEFGWATAKLDDIINWVPARLSAMVILLLNLKFDKIYIVMRDAKLHRSPNAGWPETAMATLLNIALAGPRTYNGVDGSDPYINPEGDYILSLNHITDCTKFLWQIWLIIFSLVSFGSIVYWLM